ncbi:PF09979 family protein [Leptospira weilii str. 2006001853]|uniref:PF09979 family protein n=2 Tax=Leptospira weilii TaxID=28184 RepID=A0A828YWK9_9LEPT|nr:DUF2213 domain-containing protein [Leptospira weilii]EMM73413.1 PF09979 family protein [Leptospira weilii str. 2006001855]EKR62268.1 PF09979 family protein [Leptospira weilii str. 2006001853]EKR64702.1 PF09979 family protein [Leptospira weilii str. 2006001853]EKR66182.1 PF09979 family protein [Leptospira weilii str. 2006001853]QDK22954.1 DUF2213 domain-containing protein [Leptospira weilii]
MKPEKGIRYDSATIELEGLTEDETVLRCPLVLARAGVFQYVYPDGRIVREAKLPEELFSPETLASIPGRPICDGHPPISDNDGLITDKNYSKYAKGSLGDSVEVKDGAIWVKETIWDAELKDSLKRGEKLQVSPGFRSRLDWTPGVFEGQGYDVVQREIRFNHSAHTGKGRGGESVRAYLDHADIPDNVNIAVIKTDSSQGEIMKDEEVKGSKIAQEVKGFLKRLGVRLDASEDPNQDPKQTTTTPDDKKTQAPSQETDKTKDDLIKSLTTQVATLTEALAEMKKLLAAAVAPATQDAIARDRIKLVETVKSIKADAKTDGLSERELKILVINEAFPPAEGVRLDSMEDPALNLRYESAVELAREKALVRGGGNGQGEKQNGTPKQDSDDLKTIQDARLKMNKRGDQ